VCAGPKGEGGLDDATGQSGGAGGGAGYTQTSATVDLGARRTVDDPGTHAHAVRRFADVTAVCVPTAGKMKRGDEGDSFGMKEALAQKAKDSKPAAGAR
jgi:hypothetical protein